MDDIAEKVRGLLKYEPAIGVLIWKPRPLELFSSLKEWKRWNARYSNGPAFTSLNPEGYRTGTLLGKTYVAHRVIWLIQTGSWPSEQVDHINGVRDDNRWKNLQAVSRNENMRNQKRRTDNTSGVTGVRWHRRDRKWEARLQVDGVYRHIGRFDSKKEAVEARLNANKYFGFSKRHGK